MSNQDSLSERSVVGRSLVVRLKMPKLSEQAMVQRLKSELESSLDGAGLRHVILDFQDVKFVGSVAFLAFLSLRRIQGVERLFVCNLDTNVREIFAICRLIPTGASVTAPFEESVDVESALAKCS